MHLGINPSSSYEESINFGKIGIIIFYFSGIFEGPYLYPSIVNVLPDPV
jgi:hypothetical protein